MAKFTLKIEETADGIIRSFSKHAFGGTDLQQVNAFRHIVPAGFCDKMLLTEVQELAELHGWEVELRQSDDESES